MKIEKKFELKQSRASVWEKFSDVTFVAECLPGASIVDKLGGNRYKGRMSVKLGPMAANFDGEIAIETQPEEWAGMVSGKGADPRSSSRANGSLTYQLSEAGAGATQVAIVADFNLAGALAQFSKGAIIQEVANRITAAFVQNFEAKLALAHGEASQAAVTTASAQTDTLNAGGLFWSIMRDRLMAVVHRMVPGLRAKH